MPLGWSGPDAFVCAAVSTGNSCVLNLTYAPTAASSGIQTLTLSYVFVDNASIPRTGPDLTVVIPYIATTHNNVLAAATPTGQINVVAGSGSQTVSINFTTDDGNAATNVQLTTDLTALPAGWGSATTSLPCAIVTTGSGCELHLTYAPPTAGNGTLTLEYSYTDDTGSPGTGAINIPYATTSNDNVAAVASPGGQINAVVETGGQVINVAFTTDDGKPASNLSLTSDLKTLPPGWSTSVRSFTCASVSSGNSCLLPLTYAPTTLSSGTLTLNYAYDDDSGAAKAGLLNVNYAATTNDNVGYTTSPAGPITAMATQGTPPACTQPSCTQAVSVTFTTDDGREATQLQLTPSSLSALPASWSSTSSNGFTCAAVSSGNGCQLALSYAPTAVESGTLMLNYSYINNDNVPKTGTVSIPYRSTADDTVSGTPNPSSLDNVAANSTNPMRITFTTSDGNVASLSSVDLSSLPSGWTSASPSFSCTSVSVGTACQLALTYAPTGTDSGSLSLNFSYVNNAGIPKSGTTVALSYSAGAPN